MLPEHKATAQKGEDFIIEHVYDPVKAREYYLRTRELKGRKKGQREQPATRDGPKPVSKPTTPKVPSNALTPEQRKAAVKARVTQMKARLEKLQSILDELVEQAKKRSGVDETKDVDKKEDKDTASKKDNEPQTAKEKKAAKERYEKEKAKDPTLGEEEKSLQEDIKEVREKIEKAREDLRAVVKRAREKAARKAATQGRSTVLERNSQNGS